ncbi:MAG: chitinase [Prevotellaceae bacterium]|jgi:hypothetical protein|nr:chitinase [Prevotellaceae bacterium]
MVKLLKSGPIKVVALVGCLLVLAQCATLRKSEQQSWGEAKRDWNSSYNNNDKQGVSSSSSQQSSGAGRQQAASSAKAAAKHSSTTLYASLISEAMWEELFPNRLGRGSLSSKSDFYSFAAFAEAAKHFPHFLREGSEAQRRRELAAFLAHLEQETGGLRYKEQISVAHSYAVAHKDYPPTEGKQYHGRGPIQLSYNYNYGQFSRAYFGDKSVLLKDPDLLVADSVISFGSAIWFWMTGQPPKPSCHSVMVDSWEPTSTDLSANRRSGFGLTLNIINASQCGKESAHAQKRYEHYYKYCQYFDVDKGENCECANQLPYGKKSK